MNKKIKPLICKGYLTLYGDASPKQMLKNMRVNLGSAGIRGSTIKKKAIEAEKQHLLSWISNFEDKQYGSKSIKVWKITIEYLEEVKVHIE